MVSPKVNKVIGAGVFFALLVTAVLLSTVRRASADGALVTRQDNACFVSGGPIGAPLITGDIQDVQTPSGNEKFTCHGRIAPGFEPERTVVFKVGCGGFTGSGEAHVVYTPSGRMHATCQIR
jgi:hypothetical protein